MSTQAEAPARVHRFEIRSVGDDPTSAALLAEVRRAEPGVAAARVARVYLVETRPLDERSLGRLAGELLSNPVTERVRVGPAETPPGVAAVEVHPLAGVMDPAAQSVRDAIGVLLPGADPMVSTAWRYEFEGIDQRSARGLIERLRANAVVHGVHDGAFLPDALPRGVRAEFRRSTVEIRALDDAQLESLSRDAHLFLDLEEMRSIRDAYRALEREPTDIELETLAQTWSEHCVHKTLKSRVRYSERRAGAESRCDEGFWRGRPGHVVEADGTVTIDNLLRSTVAAATFELIDEGIAWTLSVFVDNAGIVRLDDEHAVCIKVETHNHPSALEPYGGAATGIGGCIRDIIGTGLAAKPIASTDVFCVAPPDMSGVPEGCLPPARVLERVVAGVRDYGNRMGIPTVNGAVSFDERYVGNPLVYCGCVGLMPADLIEGDAQPGDRIIALGGRTGRDGIHGATFSSAELTDTHADEFSHAVQIGNAIEEKRVLDAILRARDHAGGCLFSAITDCGAGGFSSAVGEMGEKIGAEVRLDRAPLKYDGLTYTEIWISEAQERMVLAVPAGKVAEFRRICDEEHVELADLGVFGTPERELILRYHEHEVGRLPMAFLHDGIPTPEREAVWTAPSEPARTAVALPSLQAALPAVLAHRDVASKHAIVEQYDHEVQGRTVLKPLVGPGGRGPGDAAVLEPVPGSGRGIAIGCGLATAFGDPALGGDPYRMALAAIDECVRNLVCVGADPERVAILDNFCWPSCKKPQNLASLVRAAEGCYDGAKAYRTPFVSGKDSLNNQFTTQDGRTIEIPPTLLITGLGIVPDLARATTSDAKSPGNVLLVVGADPVPRLDATTFADLFGRHTGYAGIPEPDVRFGANAARLIARQIAAGRVRSAHDVSDGGLLGAIAEMCIGGRSDGAPIGAALEPEGDAHVWAFDESPARYLLEVAPEHTDGIMRDAASVGVPARIAGVLNDTDRLDMPGASWALAELDAAWRGGVGVWAEATG